MALARDDASRRDRDDPLAPFRERLVVSDPLRRRRRGSRSSAEKSPFHGTLVKLQARNRTHAVAIAVRRGLVLAAAETLAD